MSNKAKTTLAVEGITCSSCVFHINSALKKHDGVQEVEVKLKERKVIIEHDSEKVDISKLIGILREEGFESMEA